MAGEPGGTTAARREAKGKFSEAWLRDGAALREGCIRSARCMSDALTYLQPDLGRATSEHGVAGCAQNGNVYVALCPILCACTHDFPAVKSRTARNAS